MKETNLAEAQRDIDEALMAVETMEEILKEHSMDNRAIKEKFVFLSEKVNKLEGILKEEGILD
jgi:hypothetical protein